MNTIEKLVKSELYKEGDPLKLHLGCGNTKLDGYIDIDFPQDKHLVMTMAANTYTDILNDLVFPSNSVDEIYLAHLFEHFSRVIALAQLVKWRYWLKVDGILIIETPDFEGSIQQLVSEDIKYDQKMAIVRHLTGDQSAPWGMHLDQWWGERFETTLSKLGFHIIEFNTTKWETWPYLSNITVTATKLNDIQISIQIDKCLELLEESMVSVREGATFSVWEKQLRELLGEY